MSIKLAGARAPGIRIGTTLATALAVALLAGCGNTGAETGATAETAAAADGSINPSTWPSPEWPLQADPALTGGGLRVVPFILAGAEEVVAPVSALLEDVLLPQGMAAADTALAAQDGFQARIEHARYLSAHDLAAMMAMQYDNQGLTPLWTLVEAALLAPDSVEWLDDGPEPLLRLERGEVRMALFDPAGWCAHYHDGTPGEGECDRLQRVYEMFLARQRQLAAVLEAHGIPVLYVHADGRHDPRALLSQPA